MSVTTTAPPPPLEAAIDLEAGHKMTVRISEDLPGVYGLAFNSGIFEDGVGMSSCDLVAIGQAITALGDKAHARETLRRFHA